MPHWPKKLCPIMNTAPVSSRKAVRDPAPACTSTNRRPAGALRNGAAYRRRQHWLTGTSPPIVRGNRCARCRAPPADAATPVEAAARCQCAPGMGCLSSLQPLSDGNITRVHARMARCSAGHRLYVLMCFRTFRKSEGRPIMLTRPSGCVTAVWPLRCAQRSGREAAVARQGVGGSGESSGCKPAVGTQAAAETTHHPQETCRTSASPTSGMGDGLVTTSSMRLPNAPLHVSPTTRAAREECAGKAVSGRCFVHASEAGANHDSPRCDCGPRTATADDDAHRRAANRNISLVIDCRVVA